MKHIGVAAIAIVLCGAAAPAPAELQLVEVFGIGKDSCANWLSTPVTEAQGANWIVGFWSGMNVLNQNAHLIGQYSDGAGIIGETKKICLAEPSETLQRATVRVYEMFVKQGK